MDRKGIGAIVAATLALASAGAEAQAPAAPDNVERCRQLTALYDRYAAFNGINFTSHKLRRDVGVYLCASGRADEGVKLLEEAVRELGFKP
jgi:hypothetical protein